MFSEFAQFFESTFHRNWNYDLNWHDHDGPRYEFALVSYLNTCSAPVVTETFKILGNFRARNFSESQINNALSDFGCHLAPSTFDLTNYDFTERINQIFVTHIDEDL